MEFSAGVCTKRSKKHSIDLVTDPDLVNDRFSRLDQGLSFFQCEYAFIDKVLHLIDKGVQVIQRRFGFTLFKVLDRGFQLCDQGIPLTLIKSISIN